MQSWRAASPSPYARAGLWEELLSPWMADVVADPLSQSLSQSPVSKFPPTSQRKLRWEDPTAKRSHRNSFATPLIFLSFLFGAKARKITQKTGMLYILAEVLKFLGLDGPTRKPRHASAFSTHSDTQAFPTVHCIRMFKGILSTRAFLTRTDTLSANAYRSLRHCFDTLAFLKRAFRHARVRF